MSTVVSDSRHQLFCFACGHGGVTNVKDDDVVMFNEVPPEVEASETDRGRYHDAFRHFLASRGSGVVAS